MTDLWTQKLRRQAASINKETHKSNKTKVSIRFDRKIRRWVINFTCSKKKQTGGDSRKTKRISMFSSIICSWKFSWMTVDRSRSTLKNLNKRQVKPKLGEYSMENWRFRFSSQFERIWTSRNLKEAEKSWQKEKSLWKRTLSLEDWAALIWKS